MRITRPVPLVCAVVLAPVAPVAATAPAGAVALDRGATDHAEIAIVEDDGTIEETEGARESFPALSLAKLFLGYYVLENGEDEDRALVEDMIRYSEDATAMYMEARYPEAIPAVVEAFSLNDTDPADYWGNSTTTAADVAKFVAAIRRDPVAAPIIDGMGSVADYAADGYPQNFGTSTLSGISGTKFGWSDNLDVHSTVSLGPGYVVAAMVEGSAEELTADVQEAVRDPEKANTAAAEDAESGAAATFAHPRQGRAINPTAAIRKRLRSTLLAPMADLLPDSVVVPSFMARLLPKDSLCT
ncbi:hypothetical protein [Corynebacterium pacaense]|uniref:hypothetical protein n=1 Tax=Corynebacterium pacaense TaxID=1816684 RepID=UPI001FE4CB94|nr:hypothetical protein [Corynebacterium pacaense]